MAIDRDDGVLAEIVNGQAILIGRAGTHVVELNRLGSVVWEAIDGKREVDELVEVVQATVDGAEAVGVDQIRDDVVSFLNELVRLELVKS